MTALAGIEYFPDGDALMLRFFHGDKLPVRVTNQPVVVQGVRLDVAFSVDARLYMVVIHSASTHVPRAVLRDAGRRPLGLIQAGDVPGTFFVPLFPNAQAAGRELVNVDIPQLGWTLQLLLAKSSRIVGLIVPEALRNLPEELQRPGPDTPPVEDLNASGLLYARVSDSFRIQLVGELPADTMVNDGDLTFGGEHVGMATVDQQGHLLAITIVEASRRVPERLRRQHRRQPFHIELDLQHNTATVQLWSGATSNVYRDQVSMAGVPFVDLLYDSETNLLAGLTVHRAQQTLHPAFLAEAPPPPPWAR